MSQKHEVTDFLLTNWSHRHQPVQLAEIVFNPLGLIREAIRNSWDERLAQLSVALLCTGWTGRRFP
jgi:hypothetical protein